MRFLNTILNRFMIGVNVVLFVAYIIFAKMEVISSDYLHLLLGASVLSIIAYIFSDIKLRDSKWLRYWVLLFAWLIYIGIVFWTKVNCGYVAGLAVTIIFILFLDVKLSYCVMFVVVSTNAVSLYMNFSSGHMHNGDPLNVTDLMMELFAVGAYAGLYIFSMYIVVRYNNEKMAAVKRANLKTQALMQSLLGAAEVVRNNVESSTEIINELDDATENTNLIFNRIAEGNESNAESVEIQNEMSMKITTLIDDMAKDIGKAKATSAQSIDRLNTSKEFMKELQHNSEDIIVVNKKVFEAIEKFVESTKSVKQMTAGISELSEEINLLSINATIESARAGEAGKGFAVVAKAVRRLADQTGYFTEDIQHIIDRLESDAVSAQLLIKDVEETIEEESITLANTLVEFNNMEQKMVGLSEDMKTVLVSTDNVVTYNEAIREHIEQLSAQTQEVTASIEEAVNLNANNKEKTHTTTKMMKELNVVVDRLKSTDTSSEEVEELSV